MFKTYDTISLKKGIRTIFTFSYLLSRTPYHVNSFEENQVRYLLDNLLLLERRSNENNQLDEDLLSCLTALRGINNGILGEDLDPGYQITLDRFSRAYRSLGINITPPGHIVDQHLSVVVQRVERGLAIDSEQVCK
jgi:hypothetical protein